MLTGFMKKVRINERGTCQICGASFIRKSSSQKHCSPECTYKKRKATLRNGKTKGWSKGVVYVKREACIICGASFYCAPCIKRRGGMSGSFCSNTCKGKYYSEHMNKSASMSFKAGYRDDLPGKYFRSSWEANYARYLTVLKDMRLIKKWEHEKHSFKLVINGVVRFYLPDFKVYMYDGSSEFHEVKGRLDERSSLKLSAFKEQYPDIRLKVIGSREYREISKKYKDNIMFWEDRVT